MKTLTSLLLALLCIVTIEVTLHLVMPVASNRAEDSQLIHSAFYKPVRVERQMAALKLELFTGQPAEMVQVGDSSGLVSVRPSLIEPYLPPGWKYLNASLQVPAQFEGIYATAEQMLKYNPDRKYLVGVFNMNHLGRRDEGFGSEIELFYNSPWQQLLQLPSLNFRRSVTNGLFYVAEPAPAAMDIAKQMASLRKTLLIDNGWIGVDFKNTGAPQCSPGAFFDPELARQRLEKLYALANRYQVGLVVTLGPMPCQANDDTRRIESVFSAFKQAHPDVHLPMPIPNEIQAQYMGDGAHVTSKEGAPYYSHLFGAALKRTLIEK